LQIKPVPAHAATTPIQSPTLPFHAALKRGEIALDRNLEEKRYSDAPSRRQIIILKGGLKVLEPDRETP
jgi:hypothetical protein